MQLTEMMLSSLKFMAAEAERHGTAFAHPTMQTANALVRRGLIIQMGDDGGLPKFVLTEAGKAVLNSSAGKAGA